MDGYDGTCQLLQGRSFLPHFSSYTLALYRALRCARIAKDGRGAPDLVVSTPPDRGAAGSLYIGRI